MKPLIHIDNLHLHINIDNAKLDQILNIVNHHSQTLKEITMTNAELETLLVAANSKVDKISAEVIALQGTINATPAVPQSIVDAANSLAAKLQAVDDLNPDAVA